MNKSLIIRIIKMAIGNMNKVFDVLSTILSLVGLGVMILGMGFSLLKMVQGGNIDFSILSYAFKEGSWEFVCIIVGFSMTVLFAGSGIIFEKYHRTKRACKPKLGR